MRSTGEVVPGGVVVIETVVGSVTLPGPVMTASGTAGYGDELAPFVDLSALGAVVTKSLAPYEWAGNPAPRVHPTAQGMLNAVGLQGPGIEYWLAHVLPDLLATGATVVASIWGRSVDDYRRAAQMLAAAPAGVVAVEVNLSCPNLEGRGSIFAHDVELSAEVIAATEDCARPRWAKLSANTDRIVDVARAVHEAGADAVTCVNTLLGLAYDPGTLRPVLGAGAAVCRGGRSTPSQCAPSTTFIPRSPRSRSWESGEWRRAGTPSSCCWRGRARCRSGPRPSPIRGPPSGFSTNSCNGPAIAGSHASAT